MVWIQVLAVACAITTFALIVLGSAVRVTDSGMGCKGWPLCTGAQGTISSFHPVMEESHRLLASVVTVVILLLAWCVRRNERAAHLRVASLVALAVIALQIVLGAVTVYAHNAPYTVALHMLTATLFLGVVSVVAVAAFVAPEVPWSVTRGPGRLAWGAVLGLYVVFVSGSVVVSAGAQSACGSWPVCLHSASSTSLWAIQMTHRSIVLVGSILVVGFLWSSVRSSRRNRAERVVAQVAMGLFAGQVVVGALSAIWSAHSEIADVHLAVGALVWSSVVALFALRARDLASVVGPVSSDRSRPFVEQ
jgi:heme a synthase